jgi:hypothetical protein
MQLLTYLLPSDSKKKKELELYIEENEDKKIPNKEIEVQFHCQFLDLEKELDYHSYLLKRPYTEEEFIKKYILRRYKRYVLDSYEFVGLFDDNRYSRFKGKMYQAHDEYVQALDKLDFFDKISNEVYNYFTHRFGDIDHRNLYQKSDGVYLGTRGIPTAIEDPYYDKRMLGYLISGDKILTTKEYHSAIRKIKNQLKKQCKQTKKNCE